MGACKGDSNKNAPSSSNSKKEVLLTITHVNNNSAAEQQKVIDALKKRGVWRYTIGQNQYVVFEEDSYEYIKRIPGVVDISIME